MVCTKHNLTRGEGLTFLAAEFVFIKYSALKLACPANILCDVVCTARSFLSQYPDDTSNQPLESHIPPCAAQCLGNIKSRSATSLQWWWACPGKAPYDPSRHSFGAKCSKFGARQKALQQLLTPTKSKGNHPIRIQCPFSLYA